MTKFSKSAIAKMGVACLAFGLSLSSCSKEEAQVAPEVGVEKAKVSEANLRAVGPQLPTTALPVGTNTGDWWIYAGSALGGISDYQYYLGDHTKPWSTQLPMIFSGPSTFLTLRMDASGPDSDLDAVKSQISNLIVGKKYKVTLKVLAAPIPGTASPSVAPIANLYVGDNKSTVDFEGKINQWVPISVTFVAQNGSQDIDIWTSEKKLYETWAVNVIAAANSVTQIN